MHNTHTIQKFALALSLSLLSTLALADPPARVGQIGYLQGVVDYRTSYDDEATPALQNWPLTSYNVIATGPGSRTELNVGSSAIRLDADSELEIALLDDNHFQLRLLQGSANISIPDPELARDFALSTTQGQLTLNAPSQLHVDAGLSPNSTVVDLFSGAARFGGNSAALTLVAGQRVDASDNGMQIGSAQRDNFDIWSLARDQRRDRSASTRYVSPATTGYQELDQYGNWNNDVEYGAVWYPNAVPASWAPYQDGRWAWIDPWGWTWVDNAPWGYAPFHYGRWASFHGRWGWVPGRLTPRPVWAPALVGWVGGNNWRVRFDSSIAPAIGWFPLAPREVFRPSYSNSTTYLRRINVTQVSNINLIQNHNDAPLHYQNRQVQNALTVVPHDRFQGRHMVTVANSNRARSDNAPTQFANAPLSAVVPAAIAHPAPGLQRGLATGQHERGASERAANARPFAGLEAREPRTFPGQNTNQNPMPVAPPTANPRAGGFNSAAGDVAPNQNRRYEANENRNKRASDSATVPFTNPVTNSTIAPNVPAPRMPESNHSRQPMERVNPRAAQPVRAPLPAPVSIPVPTNVPVAASHNAAAVAPAERMERHENPRAIQNENRVRTMPIERSGPEPARITPAPRMERKLERPVERPAERPQPQAQARRQSQSPPQPQSQPQAQPQQRPVERGEGQRERGGNHAAARENRGPRQQDR